MTLIFIITRQYIIMGIVSWVYHEYPARQGVDSRNAPPFFFSFLLILLTRVNISIYPFPLSRSIPSIFCHHTVHAEARKRVLFPTVFFPMPYVNNPTLCVESSNQMALIRMSCSNCLIRIGQTARQLFFFHPCHGRCICGSSIVSDSSSAEADLGDIDCHVASGSSAPMSSKTRSRHAAGVNPDPTLCATIRHFSFS